MPPENTDPVVKSETTELEFETPKAGTPRIKKRSLKSKQSPATSPDARPAITPDQPRAGATTTPARPAVYAQPAATTSSEPRPTYARPSSTEERSKPAPASGVLYYTSNAQKAAKQASTAYQINRPASASTHAPTQPSRPPAASASASTQAARPVTTPHPADQRSAPSTMQTTPSSRPVSGSSTTPLRQATGSAHTGYTPPQTSTARPVSGSSTTHQASSHRPATGSGSSSSSTARAVSTTVTGPSPSAKAAGVADFRENIARQSREQKSVGSLLNFVVYGLIALFLVAGGLAIYGANDVYKQLHDQSTTVSDLDSRYSKANADLSDQLKATQQSVTLLQADLSKSQELAIRQQDTLTKLQAALDAETAALREERSTRSAETSIRSQETANLRARVRTLEQKAAENPYRP